MTTFNPGDIVIPKSHNNSNIQDPAKYEVLSVLVTSSGSPVVDCRSLDKGYEKFKTSFFPDDLVHAPTKAKATDATFKPGDKPATPSAIKNIRWTEDGDLYVTSVCESDDYFFPKHTSPEYLETTSRFYAEVAQLIRDKQETATANRNNERAKAFYRAAHNTQSESHTIKWSELTNEEVSAWVDTLNTFDKLAGDFTNSNHDSNHNHNRNRNH